ncbi:hypothetical protein FB451DRAFT_1404055 [Mycena latifolia]|nr:hypothetical protein FB451DRAFT_1404055 [Mycena latifolia]
MEGQHVNDAARVRAGFHSLPFSVPRCSLTRSECEAPPCRKRRDVGAFAGHFAFAAESVVPRPGRVSSTATAYPSRGCLSPKCKNAWGLAPTSVTVQVAGNIWYIVPTIIPHLSHALPRPSIPCPIPRRTLPGQLAQTVSRAPNDSRADGLAPPTKGVGEVQAHDPPS